MSYEWKGKVSIDGAESMAQQLGEAKNAVGGLTHASHALSQMLEGQFVGGVNGAAGALKHLWAVMLENPILGVAAVITVAVVSIGKHVEDAADKALEKTRESVAEFKRIQQSVHEAFGFSDTPEQRATKSAKAMIAGGDLSGAQRAQEAARDEYGLANAKRQIAIREHDMQAAEEAALEMGLAQKRVDIFKEAEAKISEARAKAAAEHKQQQGQQDDKIKDLNAETAELRAQASRKQLTLEGQIADTKARALALEKEAAGIRFDAVAKAEKERDAAKLRVQQAELEKTLAEQKEQDARKLAATQKEAADKAAEGRKAEAAYLESKRPLADQLRDRLADVVRLQKEFAADPSKGGELVAAQREADRLRAQMADAAKPGQWKMAQLSEVFGQVTADKSPVRDFDRHLLASQMGGHRKAQFGGHIPGENVVELDPESKRYLRTLADNLGSVRK